MKLVIQTQILENYGDDQYNPYWKAKGGTTYVVENVAVLVAWRMLIDSLRDVIEYSNPLSSETIISCDLVDDDAVVCEHWETPVVVTLEDSKLIATITTEYDSNNDHDVVSKVERYTMLAQGHRDDYAASYTMTSGKVLDQYSNEVSA